MNKSLFRLVIDGAGCVRLSFRARLLVGALAGSVASHSQVPGTVHRLPPAEVTVYRFPDQAVSLPAGVSVITAEQIHSSGASTINEALMRLLGVVGRQDFFGGGEYSLDLRGFGSTADKNQVIIVDGQRLNEADLGGTRLAGIPIETVQRIEVLRGSAAVLYGEGASGGVIVVTTKSGQGLERRNTGSVYLGLGSFSTREWRGNATLVGGGFSLDVAAQGRDSDNHRDNFRSSADALSSALQWSNDWLRVGLRLSRDNLDSRLPGALSAAQFAANPAQSTTPNDRASIGNQRHSIYTEAFLGNWVLAADLGQRSKELKSLNSGFPFDYDIDASNASLRARHDGKLGAASNVLVFGLDHAAWRRVVAGFFGSQANQKSNAFYIKDDIMLAGGTRLSAGWRSEQVRKQDSSTAAAIDERQQAWELGASQALGADWTAFGRLARSFRLAGVDEFNFTSPGAILRPQTSRDFETGLRWNRAATRLEARLYRSQVRDEIGFDPSAPGPFGPGANVNFDPTQRQGLEIEASHALSPALMLRANLATRQARFRSGPNAGRDVPLVPGQTMAFRADWLAAPGHRLSGGVNWVSSQHPDFANQCKIPAYQTVDLRYAYESGSMEFSLGLSNLFDRKFYTQAFACTAGTTSAIYPEPGRAVTAALRLRF